MVEVPSEAAKFRFKVCDTMKLHATDGDTSSTPAVNAPGWLETPMRAVGRSPVTAASRLRWCGQSCAKGRLCG